jgi:hypothetical protein
MSYIHISRSHPACIVFAVDRSGSTAQQVKGRGNTTLSDIAAALVNITILDLVLSSAKARDNIWHYFDIGIFGYGYCPELGTASVRSILPGHLAELPLCDLPTLAKEPLRVEQKTNQHRVPVWLDPSHEGRTPMCQAFDEIGSHLAEWAATHPESPPPVVVNISDGLVTDSPHKGTNLEGWLNRLSVVGTTGGVVKVFDIVLSTEGGDPVLRPAVIGALTLPGWTVAQVASIMPSMQVSTWASLPALSLESDYTAPDFVRRAELADDIAPHMPASERV